MKVKILLVTFLLILILFVAGNALAMTDQERQTLIAQIQQQIAQLTQQLTQMLAQQQGTQTWCHDFNTNLNLAQSGLSEVISLHVALQIEGISYSPDGINIYSTGTVAAVKQFQTKYAIFPHSGKTGPLTRAKLNQLYGCGTNAVAPTPTPPFFVPTPTPPFTLTPAPTLAPNSTPTPAPINAIITLTSPNGGEQLSTGSTVAIRWTASRSTSSGMTYTPGNIKIDLYKGGSLVRNLIPYTTTQTYFSWRVPVLASGNDYKIRVSIYGAENIYDESDTSFSISGAITITSPKGGENFAAGSTVQIVWSAPGRTGINAVPIIPNVKIDLYKGGRLLFQLVPRAPSNGTVSSSYTWTVPASYYESYIDNFYSNDYKIRVSNADDLSVYDESNAGFSISTFSHNITVISPNGNESFAAGSAQRITWTSSGTLNATNVKIELYKAGVSVQRIALDAPNTGYYNGKILKTLKAGNDYKVRISNVGDTSIYDESDANFSIFVIPQSITVIAPSLGEQLNLSAGSTYRIRWETAGSEPPAKVKIQLYKGGVFVQDIVFATVNYNLYTWSVPANLVAGNDYKIKVSSYGGYPVSDESEVFSLSIIPRYIKVETPNGGEGWRMGESHQITWTSSDMDPNLPLTVALIDYTSGGLRMYSINTRTAKIGDGSFTFSLIPASIKESYPVGFTFSPSNRYKIFVAGTPLAANSWDIPVPVAQDESDGYFTIAP